MSQRLLANRIDRKGHWIGQLSASALSTATAISALSFYLDAQIPGDAESNRIVQQIDGGFAWLIDQQNSDGGFGDTTKSYSNISTTMLVIAATAAAGRTDSQQSMIVRAQGYVESQGSIAGLRRRYGKDKTFAVPILANCAMAGIVPWSQVSALPFEAACVPQRFYHWMQLPVVSYAIPALVAIGQVKFHCDPPWDPVRRWIRRRSIARSLRVLQRMQPASGGFLEAVPLTSFVAMGLIKSGQADHRVVKQCIQFLLDSFRSENELGGDHYGSWPIDTNLATWSSTLSINALANDPMRLKKLVLSDVSRWEQCLDWILDCQNSQVHPFTGSPAGGWGWTDLSGAVPDADDTPGALLALRNLLDTGAFENRRSEILSAVQNGLQWLLKLQNRDRGWPTFCRGWGKLPFDRSGADITAHAIRALLIWRSEWDKGSLPNTSIGQLDAAIDRGLDYLAKMQKNDGSWTPLWFGNQDQPGEENPCYGTAKVLAAYRLAKLVEFPRNGKSEIDTQAENFGLDWIVKHQNADGGWGGGRSIEWPTPSLGHSSVEETALCCESLLGSDDDQHRSTAAQGIDWLIRASECDSITRSSPIGFYFAKLWYFEESYPLIFSTAALSKASESR